LSEAVSGAQQEINNVDNMEIDDSGPTIQHSLAGTPCPHIIYFLYQILHVNTQSPKVWCKNDSDGHIRYTLLIEAHKTTQNRPKDIFLHIRYLTDFSPFPNLVFEDSKSTDNKNELTQLSRG
jgi:hypothetical protein